MMLGIEEFQKKGPCRLFSAIRHTRGSGETIDVDNNLPVTAAQFLSVVH